jgi:hypothetical protein
MLTANGGHTLTLGKAFEPNIEAEIDTFAVRVPQTVDVPMADDVPIKAQPPKVDAATKAEVLTAIDFDGALPEGVRLRDPGGTDAAGAEGRDGLGFALDGRSKVIVSDRADLIEGLQGFEMTAAIAKDAADGHGRIMSIHSSFKLDVLRDGSLKLWLKTDEGDYAIRTEAGLLATTEWHEVGARFDGTAGEMAILLGGEEVAAGEAAGAMPGTMHQHLMVGRAYGASVEGRVDDIVLRSGPTPADQFEFAAKHGGDGIAAGSDATSLAPSPKLDDGAVHLAASRPGGDGIMGFGDAASFDGLTDTMLVG